ncbi:hypothetical protein JCM9957A_31140 [Kineosporia succinea]
MRFPRRRRTSPSYPVHPEIRSSAGPNQACIYFPKGSEHISGATARPFVTPDTSQAGLYGLSATQARCTATLRDSVAMTDMHDP